MWFICGVLAWHAVALGSSPIYTGHGGTYVSISQEVEAKGSPSDTQHVSDQPGLHVTLEYQAEE